MRSESQASVLIPTKNRGRVVVDAVRSALGGEGVGEVIVVDDGSSDDTQEKLRALGSMPRVLRGHFGSPAAARNAGAAAARYPLLAFLDSDDQMLPGKIPCLAPRFADPLVALVHGRTVGMEERGLEDLATTMQHEALYRLTQKWGTGYAGLANHCGMFTSAIVVRKEAFDSIGGYDETLGGTNEDFDLYLRLSRDWKLVYEDCPVARYRVWSDNFRSLDHTQGQIAVSLKHLALLRGRTSPDASLARYGLYRRLARSSQTLLATGDTRRYAIAAVRSQPARGLRDLGLLRLLAASYVPRSILERRRTP